MICDAPPAVMIAKQHAGILYQKISCLGEIVLYDELKKTGGGEGKNSSVYIEEIIVDKRIPSLDIKD